MGRVSRRVSQKRYARQTLQLKMICSGRLPPAHRKRVGSSRTGRTLLGEQFPARGARPPFAVLQRSAVVRLGDERAGLIGGKGFGVHSEVVLSGRAWNQVPAKAVARWAISVYSAVAVAILPGGTVTM